MQPTLRPGSYVLFRRARSYGLGEIVLISHNNLDKVKRITRINNNKYFVVGDNFRGSTDSRSFGEIDKSNIRGKILWPKKIN
jgi:phage repressor protein C with HTH and peptisase S24 domain